MKKLLRILWIIVVLVVAFFVITTQTPRFKDTPTVALANPASVYCQQQSGTLEIVSDASGAQSWICHLSGWVDCEERAYMRGECPVFVDTDNQPKEDIPVGWESCDFNETYEIINANDRTQWISTPLTCSSWSLLHFTKTEEDKQGMGVKVDLYDTTTKIFAGFPASFNAIWDQWLTKLYYQPEKKLLYREEWWWDVCYGITKLFLYDFGMQKYLFSGINETLEYDTVTLTNQQGNLHMQWPIPLWWLNTQVSFDGLQATYNGNTSYIYKLPQAVSFTYEGCWGDLPYSLWMTFDLSTLTVAISDTYKKIIYNIYDLSNPTTIEDIQ